ncbi:hypothetical protein J3R30DRAFT_1034336 [Lentinula aciculospora]|uniref:S-adenosyl-L-methionine-dependent methyltransferase n=1 Tax=Lentinula aciculospora TaxID=153920 RepID=A0A9W9A1B1_9AGAR|nr:hypothetical protein J3R30DRAFT_1034336 [Lentinula aciculospora]
MAEQLDKPGLERYYVSTEYLLPADKAETVRLNEQHSMIIKAFENRLFLAPVNFNNGDKVLESAAGSGIWALAFAAENMVNSVELDIECIDISPKQFPTSYPSHIHFSVHSVVKLPLEWTNTFSYIHQRFIGFAMNDLLWNSAINELFRVTQSGGWIELFEIETKSLSYCDVGPSSNVLCSLWEAVTAQKGIIGNVSAYLCPLLEKTGFVHVHCETRDIPIGGRRGFEGGNGYSGELWGEGWMAMKAPLIKKENSDAARVSEEYNALVQGAKPLTT